MKRVIAQMSKKADEENLSLKEKLILGFSAAVILTGTVLLGKKFVQNQISNREEKKSFEEGTPATYAKQIKMAFENDGWPGTDMDRLRNVLIEIPTKAEFEKVAKSYQKLYANNLMKDLSSELQSTQYNEMLSIIAAKGGQRPSDNYQHWAKRLKAAFDKSYGLFPGTDEEAIKAVFTEVPSQSAFVETGKAYAKLFGSDLIKDLKGELEVWEYGDYMKIITSKPS